MKETHTMPNGDIMPGASHSPNKQIGAVAGMNTGMQPMPPQQAMPTQQAGMIPQPSSLVNPFMPADQSAIMKIYGKAQVPGTAFRMEDDSPLESNAFIGALEAAKAGGEKSFNVNGKTYPVK